MRFANAVKNQNNVARTTNGMKALKSSTSSCVDLFFKIGASRGKNVVGDFTNAYKENREYALRIAQWARDARQGSGERQIYRDILSHLDKTDPAAGVALLRKTPELGRWDDMLIDFTNPEMRDTAFSMIKEALNKGDGLCAKWMPRKGPMAAKLRASFGWTPKYYRKRLVELTKVVEQLMCANKWEEINFNHVPSVASARYKKAFGRHAVAYEKWTEKLAAGDKDVKVNAGAVYPYDVIKGLMGSRMAYTKANESHIVAQWNALPNYVGDASILPVIDVSGSMCSPAGGYGSKSEVSCMDVSVSLGLYLADKNKGVFKDTFLTFSGNPKLVNVEGNIVEKINKIDYSDWQSNTDLNKAIQLILDVAVRNDVPASEMPKILLVLSDMQFDQCARYDDSAIDMIARKYEKAGYVMPQVVFWNLNASDNVPVSMHQKGVALVSGFSPAIVKSVLAVDFEQFTPEGIMKKTIMNARYDI